jgi:hypothetical protein
MIEKEAFDGLKLEDAGGTGGTALLDILCSKYYARLTVVLLDSSVLSRLLAFWSQNAFANSTSFVQAGKSEDSLLQGASGKTSSRTRLYAMQ